MATPVRINETVRGVEITGPMTAAYRTVLTPEAIEFVQRIARHFEGTRRDLLDKRKRRKEEIAAGALPGFLLQTERIRAGHWMAAPIPHDLMDRRVEITGPTERKMIINALNSGASVFMADFEDSNSPTWQNCVEGQINLRDAVRGTISYTSPEGKQYKLGPKTAVLMVRPRGWHLDEKHFLVDGEPIAAAFFDFGLHFFHNARKLLEKGTGPYFYLPKMESHLEARLWNNIFLFAQDELGLRRGTIRATVLIETILAAFEMDEILYELREHSAGVNCGRWDYIFSFIKTFRNRPDFVLPDRATVTMERHFLDSYVQLLIETCHRRHIHAMGGMAAQIPIKSDAEANERALDKVKQDKLREVKAGHDGTWVAHPGLVPVAKEIFDQHMPEPNQIWRRPEKKVAAADLLAIPEGKITAGGLRWNIDVGIQYLASWLGGNGCVPIYNLMEDAATAEISRAQVWQWVRHGAKLDDGRAVTPELVRRTLDDVKESLRGRLDPALLERAGLLFDEMMTSAEFPEFLTLAAYRELE